MSEDNCSQIYYYKQVVDNIEEVFKLKKCFIDLGKRIETPSEDYISSDEEYKYFGYNSGTESYDSDRDGFHLIVKEYYRRVEEMDGKAEERKKRSKKKCTSTKSRSKAPEPEPEMQMEVQSLPIEDCVNIADQSLLEDDFYEKSMQLFMSQSLPMTQSSAVIQQNGKFSYYRCSDIRDESLRIEMNVDYLLLPLTDVIEDKNCWPLVIKTVTEYVFAFRNPSKWAKILGHRLLAHYNWSEDRLDISPEELSHIRRLHNQFMYTYMREILLNCYSRHAIMEVIGGSDDETNAWPFVKNLIIFLINEWIRKSDCFEMAFTHFKYIVELLVKDFQQFLSDSNDYCTDIQRMERERNNRPLISYLIWSQKTPNYLNSVLKVLIFLITKVIKTENDSLLIQVFKLFEVSAECYRIGSGNVRPYTSYTFDKPTPVTQLFQQLSDQSLATNEVFVKLMGVSNLCWIKLQLCGHFMTTFVVGLRNRYLKERIRKISLKLIVECLTNVKFLTKTIESANSRSITDHKSNTSTPETETRRRRSSIGLVNKTKSNSSGKEWSKKNKYGENALHRTCIKGKADELRLILEQSVKGFGPDPNDTDNAGYTPLCEAALNCHPDCIRALIQWQNDSDKSLDFEAGPKKQTALHDSIENNAIECAKLIIESGGIELLNICREIDGKTPKDLIKCEEMKAMIDSLTLNLRSKSFVSKISINNDEDSKVFTQIIINLIMSYIETTKIDHFLEELDNCEDSSEQILCPNTSFEEIFQRELNETDYSSIIEDLAVFRQLPKIVDNLKTLFSGSAIDLLKDLEFGLNLFLFEK